MKKLKDIIQERKVLSVFDFDDTIAKSDAWIYVTRQGRTIKKLDPAQFAVYKPRPGEDFDFKDFDRKIRNPRLIKQNADLLRKQLAKAQKASKGARKVTILTARRLGAPVTSFLKTMGIDAYVVPLGNADPQKKADWIEAQVKKGYDTVYFMDDSNKNIAAVNNMLNKYPHVKSITKLIKEDNSVVQYKNRALRYNKRLNHLKEMKLKTILEGVLSEGMSKNKVQTIVDRVFPQIVQDRGTGRKGIPEIKFHHDIYALHSGIDDMRGEESETTKAQWIYEKNTIWIFYPNIENEEDLIRTVLHEFEHTHQDPIKNKKYREQGYDDNPYEKAARNAEKKWRDYL